MSEDKIYYGEVCWFSSKKGYGFLAWEIDGVKQTDMFCHFSDIISDGFKTLYTNQKVSFSIGTNKHGSPKATNIVVQYH